MAKEIICDVCGKPIRTSCYRKMEFKCKARKESDFHDEFGYRHWEEVDIHEDCYIYLTRLIKAHKEFREETGADMEIKDGRNNSIVFINGEPTTINNRNLPNKKEYIRTDFEDMNAGMKTKNV